jgi:hypothetical protein
MLSVAFIVLANVSIHNDFLKMMDLNNAVFQAFIISAVVLIATASIGFASSTSSNHCLSFFVINIDIANLV